MSEAQEKDLILKFLYNSSSPSTVETISNIVSHLGLTNARVEMLCSLIKDDDYIVYTTGTDGACKIKNKGRSFFEQGGYSQLERINQLQTVNAETKHELEIQQLQSVIATNTATVAAYNNQEKLNKKALYLTGASVLFIIISTILQLSSKTDKELQGIKEQLQTTSRTLDSIHLSLKSSDSSMKTYLNHVNYQDTSRH